MEFKKYSLGNEDFVKMLCPAYPYGWAPTVQKPVNFFIFDSFFTGGSGVWSVDWFGNERPAYTENSPL